MENGIGTAASGRHKVHRQVSHSLTDGRPVEAGQISGSSSS